MKLSLNEIWKRCLKMWKEVVIILEITEEESGKIPVYAAKKIWLKLNGYNKHIYNDCFFCDYAVQKKLLVEPDVPGGCPDCPGTKIDPDFACQIDSYHWANNPEAFYQKLLRLDKKRRRNKK